MKNKIFSLLLIVVAFLSATAQNNESLTLSGKVNSICYMPPNDPAVKIEGYIVEFTEANGKTHRQGITKQEFEKIKEAMESKKLEKVIVHRGKEGEYVEVVLH